MNTPQRGQEMNIHAVFQCDYGPHWHEQLRAEEAQKRCKNKMHESIGEVLAMLNTWELTNEVSENGL